MLKYVLSDSHNNCAINTQKKTSFIKTGIRGIYIFLMTYNVTIL